MSTTPAVVRAAIAVQTATTTLSAGGALRESMTPYLFFRDPARSPAHLEFAVHIQGTRAVAGRQRTGGAVYVESDVRVITAYQIPTHTSGVDAAMVVEDEQRRCLLERTGSYPLAFHLEWVSSDRSPGPAGWVLIESVFTAAHHLPT